MHQVNNRQNAFTLIEIMIVVAVIAILASIALPNYFEYVRQARRADAYTALAKVELAQEKYRVTNANYASAVSTLGLTNKSDDGYYDISITSSTGVSYTVAANGSGSSQSADTGCVTLTLAYANGTTSRTPPTCWKK